MPRRRASLSEGPEGNPGAAKRPQKRGKIEVTPGDTRGEECTSFMVSMITWTTPSLLGNSCSRG